MPSYHSLSEAFCEMAPMEEPIKGLNSLLKSAFMAGATATLRLLQDGADIPELLEELRNV